MVAKKSTTKPSVTAKSKGAVKRTIGVTKSSSRVAKKSSKKSSEKNVKKSTKKITKNNGEKSSVSVAKNRPVKKINSKNAKKVIRALFDGEHVLTEQSDQARELYNQARYGQLDDVGRVQLSLIESLYLFEKGKIIVTGNNGRAYTIQGFIRRIKAVQPKFWTRYQVFRDMRNRGYIVKTALKFGADFRIYDRGVKPGEDHARWVLFPIHEGSVLTWHDFAAKNRVAHSTKKRLLIGIVDEEADVTYYEVAWKRP